MDQSQIPTSAILALALAACTGEAKDDAHAHRATGDRGGELIARNPGPEADRL